jgi:hypothetical protein
MAHGKMEGIHLFFILFLNSLTMNSIKFELVHLPRIVMMLKFWIRVTKLWPAFNNPSVRGLCYRFHYILIGPWFDSGETFFLNTLGAIERWGVLLRFFFRASGKSVVFLKKKSTIECWTARIPLISRRRVARRFVGGREIVRTCVLEFLKLVVQGCSVRWLYKIERYVRIRMQRTPLRGINS